MKNKELIKELQRFDPEKEVMIKQGEDYDYMRSEIVRTEEVVDWESLDIEPFEAIVIEY